MASHVASSAGSSPNRDEPANISPSATSEIPISAVSPIVSRGPNRRDFKVFGAQSKILPPGQSSKFKVVFKPSKRGWRNAYIQVLSNDAANGPYTIKLVGTGVRSKLLNPFDPD